jgi:hypothetical protein
MWKDDKTVRDYLAWLSGELGHSDLVDWYTIHDAQALFEKHHGNGLLNAFGSLDKLLSAMYPNHLWESWRFTCAKGNSK